MRRRKDPANVNKLLLSELIKRSFEKVCALVTYCNSGIYCSFVILVDEFAEKWYIASPE